MTLAMTLAMTLTMTLKRLIWDEFRDESLALLATACVAGVSSVLIMALINDVAGNIEHASTRNLGLLLLVGTLYVVCSRYTFHQTTKLTESAILKLRLRLVDKIDSVDVLSLEQIGMSEVYDRLTENVKVISASSRAIAHLFQSITIVAGGSIYIVWISPVAFAILALTFTLGASLFYAKSREVDIHLHRAASMRVVFLERLTDLLQGLKELRASRQRSKELRAELADTSRQLRTLTEAANNRFADNEILAQCVLYVLLASIVFLLPMRATVDGRMVTTLVATLLFFWGPLGGVIGGVPDYIQSEIALSNISDLEAKLDAFHAQTADDTSHRDPWGGRFSTIQIDEAIFEYPGDADFSFQLGPMNLTVEAGEVIFLVGGNGSGKSTFMKVLTGLYRPISGRVLMDGSTIHGDNSVAYREMFSTIFSDFHLFSKLYGLLDVEESKVRNLLEQMQLDGKTSFADGGFTNRELSTGQRKRLAMIVVLLEDRPIYVFDEWAADQDPEFRKYFYRQLVPTLKELGKTVIAVTHDDRYFECADRVVTLDYGQVRSIERVKRDTDE